MVIALNEWNTTNPVAPFGNSEQVKGWSAWRGEQKMEQKTTWLTAPSLQNSSCSHPRYASVRGIPHLTAGDVAQASIVLLLSLGILVANILVIVVINSRRYSKHIHSQPRYLLTSLASNDLAIGLMVTPFGFLPALYRCWPYGELFCQIQVRLFFI